MKLDLNLSSLLKAPAALLRPLARHQYFIALLVMLCGLAVAVYMVNNALNMPTDDTYRAELLKKTVGTQFNKNTQETIDKIESLQRSSEQSSQNQTLPSGRINPFAE